MITTWSHIPSFTTFNAVATCAILWVLVKWIRVSRRRLHTTRLRGPPNPSFVYGVAKLLLNSDDPASMYESWAMKYGGAYEIPSALGKRRIILYDPKAIAHFHSKDTWTYVRTPLVKQGLEHAFGRGLFSVDGESHRRQRKTLNPAFSVSSIRNLTPIYYDSAHKAKVAWNTLIESSGQNSVLIDVQNWMNHISFDTIGLAGFSHDFGALDGKRASVTRIFDTISSSSKSASHPVFSLLAEAFPFLVKLPTNRTKLFVELSSAMEEILSLLMARTKNEFVSMGVMGDREEKSIIGLLIKQEDTNPEVYLSKEEMLAQMKVLLLAGYETTAIVMTWALIELSRNPEIQTKLRNELLEYESDPTYDQLTNGLPFLDAFVHEVLRVHTPIPDTMRLASEDDVIPLSTPVRTRSGQLVENLSISKGTVIGIPMASINISTAIWGEDAKTFKPSRWLEDDQNRNGAPRRARDILGHRHLLTFSDGPRTCLGKLFAITEFKAVLSVLIKNFAVELRDGVDTEIEVGRGILPRPRIAGEVGCVVPLRVRPYIPG